MYLQVRITHQSTTNTRKAAQRLETNPCNTVTIYRALLVSQAPPLNENALSRRDELPFHHQGVCACMCTVLAEVWAVTSSPSPRVEVRDLGVGIRHVQKNSKVPVRTTFPTEWPPPFGHRAQAAVRFSHRLTRCSGSSTIFPLLRLPTISKYPSRRTRHEWGTCAGRNDGYRGRERRRGG